MQYCFFHSSIVRGTTTTSFVEYRMALEGNVRDPIRQPTLDGFHTRRLSIARYWAGRYDDVRDARTPLIALQPLNPLSQRPSHALGRSIAVASTPRAMCSRSLSVRVAIRWSGTIGTDAKPSSRAGSALTSRLRERITYSYSARPSSDERRFPNQRGAGMDFHRTTPRKSPVPGGETCVCDCLRHRSAGTSPNQQEFIRPAPPGLEFFNSIGNVANGH
jgi:hypothetical protein